MKIVLTDTFCVIWLMFNIHIVHGYPDWVVNERVLGYGDNVTLFCVIDDCCKKTAGWIKLDPNYTTIFLDVRDFRYKTSKKEKYAATTNSTGFSLVITNVQEDDFNVKYLCSYGFEKSRQKFLLQSEAFRDEETRSGSELPVAGIIIGSVIGSVIILIIAAVVFILKLKQNRRIKKRNADIAKTYEESPKNDHDVCVNLLKEKEEMKLAHQTTNLTDCGADIIMVHPGDESKMSEWKP